MSELALIGLGSNLGDRKANLDLAVAMLRATPGLSVTGLSSFQETAPAGGPGGQGAFLNAAVRLTSDLEPLDLLRRLHEIEAEAGRERAVRWGERTLDADLLLHGNRIVDSAELTVPHPRMAVRRFVLAPLAEIAPDSIDPITKRTIADLLENLDRRPSFVCMIGRDMRVIFRRVSAGLNAIGLFEEDGWGENYDSQTSLVSRPDFASIIAQRAREYAWTRWSDDIWGDRWVISDFWFDLIGADIGYLLDGDSTRGSALKAFLDARDRVIQPTFLVATSPYTYSRLRSLFHRPRYGYPVLKGVPILCPGYNDPLGFEREHPLTVASMQSVDPALVDLQVSEILAACAACRP